MGVLIFGMIPQLGCAFSEPVTTLCEPWFGSSFFMQKTDCAISLKNEHYRGFGRKNILGSELPFLIRRDTECNLERARGGGAVFETSGCFNSLIDLQMCARLCYRN